MVKRTGTREKHEDQREGGDTEGKMGHVKELCEKATTTIACANGHILMDGVSAK